MTRWERFFFWLGRVNAVGIFIVVVFFLGTFATELYREYTYYREIEETRFGHAADNPSTFTAEAVKTSEGDIAAYFRRDGDSFERLQGSGITLVNPRTGRTREIAGSADAWVLNWELIFRSGNKSGNAIGYIAQIVNEEQYAAGLADLVVGNLPALEQKVVARNVDAVDLPTVHGDTGASLILWHEDEKAAFIAIDLRDLSITEQREIPLPPVRANNLTQGPGPRRNPRPDDTEGPPAPSFR